jgi:hypothetical protein
MNATRAELARLNAALDAADAKARTSRRRSSIWGSVSTGRLPARSRLVAIARVLRAHARALRHQPGINIVGDRFVFQSEVRSTASALLWPEACA